MSRFRQFWRGFTKCEKAVVLICVPFLIAALGTQISRQLTAPPLPPLFIDAPRANAGGVGAADSTGAQPASTIHVHVAGEVRRPGVIFCPLGSRVGDAIAMAGGATERADLNALNLAAAVVDGQKIVVPSRHPD